MYIIERRSKDNHVLTVVNTGQGLDRHPVSAHDSSQISRKVGCVMQSAILSRLIYMAHILCVSYFQVCFSVTGIAKERIVDTHFWFLMFRSHVWPSAVSPPFSCDCCDDSPLPRLMSVANMVC